MSTLKYAWKLEVDIMYYHMMTSYIKETGMLVKNLLTHLARLVNHKCPRRLRKGHENQSTK